MSIKFEHTEVFNFEGAIRGMRNPLESWDKSDSHIEENCNECQHKSDYSVCKHNPIHKCFDVVIGENDLALMKKLIKAGSDHRKFMRQIIVSVDITAPLYWWKEFDTYKVATVSNSCSTMHKIHAKEFTLEDFSHDHLDEESIVVLESIIEVLNCDRNIFIGNVALADGSTPKDYWWNMIQLLPSSYNQRRTITLNYETLYNIYGSRRNHKLTEWSEGFVTWIESLPYAKELIIDRG